MTQSPCRWCEHRPRCRTFKLACSAFVEWIEPKGEKSWKEYERKPTEELYKALFGDDS